MKIGPNSAPDSREIRPLTGIRGFAAVWIVLYHFYASWGILLPSLQAGVSLASRGYLGVDLFFILSGFILSYVYGAGDANARFGPADYGRFLWFRLARVLPNHIATLAILAMLVAAAPLVGIAVQGDYPLSGLPFQVTMIHAWPFVHGGAWNYPSWALSAEWFAYLCIFPAVWHLLRLRFGATASLVIGYAVLALWLFVLSAIPVPSWFPLLQVSCEFIAGGMFYCAYSQGSRVMGACQRCASALFVMVLGISWFYPANGRFASPIIVLLFPALLLGLTSGTSRLSRLLGSWPALWFGRMSYALYMSHAIAQKVLKVVLPPRQYMTSPLFVRLLLLFANGLLILLFAVGLYYAVEIPARNYLRRMSTRGPHRTAKPGA